MMMMYEHLLASSNALSLYRSGRGGVEGKRKEGLSMCMYVIMTYDDDLLWKKIIYIKRGEATFL